MQDIIKIYLYAKRLALYSDLENERNNIYNELNNRAVTCIFSKTELNNYLWKPMGSFLCLFESDNVTLYVKNNQGTWSPISVNVQELVDTGFDYSYEDPDYISPVSITVEPFGDSYGFDLNEEGYYVNNNSTIDQSYAMCKIVINNTSDTDQMLNLKVNQQSENGCDFGMFSLLNTDLVASMEDTTTNVAISFQNNSGDIDYNIGVPVGESYITVKYRKDGSISQETDTFKFKLVEDNTITVTKHLATIEQVEEKIRQAISTVYKYKGSVANEASLPTTDNEVGDVYNCEDTGNNFAWTGTAWDKLAGTIDLSNYYTKTQSDARAAAIADEKIAAIPGGSSNPTVYYLDRADYAKDDEEVLTIAQEIYDQITSGNKDVILVFRTKINGYYETNLCYYNESASSETSIQFVGTFSTPEPSTKKEKNGYTQIALYRMIATIYATDGVVTQVSNSHNWADMAKVIAISGTTQQPYMATKPWHPVSKQYADDVSKVVKQVDVLPDREWITWDNASDLSNKAIKISEGLHNYNRMDYDPDFTDQYKVLLTSNTGYSIAIDTYDRDDEYRCSWVLLNNGSVVQQLAYISEYEYEDYVVVNNTLPSNIGVFSNEVLGTSEMPDALIYLGGFPQDFIYQVGDELHISIGESFVKLATTS